MPPKSQVEEMPHLQGTKAVRYSLQLALPCSCFMSRPALLPVAVGKIAAGIPPGTVALLPVVTHLGL